MEQIETFVVRVDQLSRENMMMLVEAGYSVLNDPRYIIMARAVQPQQPQHLTVVPNEDDAPQP